MTDLNYKEMYENEVMEKTKLKQACKVLTEQNHELAVEVTALMIKLAEVTKC